MQPLSILIEIYKLLVIPLTNVDLYGFGAYHTACPTRYILHTKNQVYRDSKMHSEYL